MRPQNLFQCFDENFKLDIVRYMLYRKHCRDEDEEFDQLLSTHLFGKIHPHHTPLFPTDSSDSSTDYYSDDILNDDRTSSSKQPQSKPAKNQKRRRCKAYPLEIRDAITGKIRPMKPTESVWYKSYVLPDTLARPSDRLQFRRRFRMTRERFKDLLGAVCAASSFKPAKNNENEEEKQLLFGRWQSCDAVGKKSSPLELLLLGSLRYLGRGWTFDDLREVTAISVETHRQFFHVFLEWGSVALYRQCVVSLQEKVEKYQDGCIGSYGVMHIGVEKCAAIVNNHNTLRNKFNAMASRTYTLTVDKNEKILSSCQGLPIRPRARDVLYCDSFVEALRKKDTGQNHVFELWEYNKDPRESYVTRRKYRGSWLSVRDCKILEGPCLYHSPVMNDDIASAFAKMKGRFRILKTGVRLFRLKDIDKVWYTCCALHNFLSDLEEKYEKRNYNTYNQPPPEKNPPLYDLDINSYDDDDDEEEHIMTRSVRNEEDEKWDGKFGWQDHRDVTRYAPVTVSQRYRDSQTDISDICKYDESGMGFGNDLNPEENLAINEELKAHSEGNVARTCTESSLHKNDANEPDVCIVRSLDPELFQKRLEVHYEILRTRKRSRS